MFLVYARPAVCSGNPRNGVQAGLDLPRGEVSGEYDSGIHVSFGNIKMRMVVADFLTEAHFSPGCLIQLGSFQLVIPLP